MLAGDRHWQGSRPTNPDRTADASNFFNNLLTATLSIAFAAGPQCIRSRSNRKKMNGSENGDAYKVETPNGVSFDVRPRGRTAVRPDNHYVLDLIQVLQAYPGGRRRWSIMHAIRTNRRKAGLRIPHQIEDDVQRAFLEHCADTASYKRRNRASESALFHWPQGKAAGMWAVYPDRVDTWMREHIPAL